MVTVFICDDDQASKEKYSGLIAQIGKKLHFLLSISTFAGGEELIFHLTDSPNLPDIIILEAALSPINGVETAKKLRAQGCVAQMIFLSLDKEYVFDAFDVAPVQYLLKDQLSPERFEQVFLKAMELSRSKQAEMITCEAGNTSRVIAVGDISYFEIWKRIIVVHYGSGNTFEFYGTMEQLESKLSSKFFARAHRSFLVNLQYISELHPQSLLLKTGEKIPIGVTHAKSMKKAFADYAARFQIRIP